MPYRFSGHESFAWRYAWLPKAIRALNREARIFSNEDNAMVELGIGKNMVRSLRFWMQAAGVAEPSEGGGYRVTPFGAAILGVGGFDPFLEDVRTLWLFHWKISTIQDAPLFAWDYLFNHWTRPEFSRSEALGAFRREANLLDRPVSDVTLDIHVDVFLHTYMPGKAGKAEFSEDTLDCPLVELGLLLKVGERKVDETGRREAIYAFRRQAKPELSASLFLFCLDDYRRTRLANERTISLRQVALGHGSPGAIFKLPDWDVRERVDLLNNDGGPYLYRDSAATPSVQLDAEDVDPLDLLAKVYAIPTGGVDNGH